MAERDSDRGRPHRRRVVDSVSYERGLCFRRLGTHEFDFLFRRSRTVRDSYPDFVSERTDLGFAVAGNKNNARDLVLRTQVS